jgi:hypothetical protein
LLNPSSATTAGSHQLPRQGPPIPSSVSESGWLGLSGEAVMIESIGLYPRVGQRLLAMAAAIWHNTLTGAPTKRSLVAYDH